MPRRAHAVLAAAGCAAVLAGCGGSDKAYDISPIFPLTADKCARYNGDESGSGFAAKCMVTKAECERAVADWREAMRGIDDAINFSCG